MYCVRMSGFQGILSAKCLKSMMWVDYGSFCAFFDTGSGGNGGNGGEGSSYDDDGEDEDNKNSGKSLLLSIYGVLIGGIVNA